MDETSKWMNIDFMISVGDNMYDNGIESMDNLTPINTVMNYF